MKCRNCHNNVFEKGTIRKVHSAEYKKGYIYKTMGCPHCGKIFTSKVLDADNTEEKLNSRGAKMEEILKRQKENPKTREEILNGLALFRKTKEEQRAKIRAKLLTNGEAVTIIIKKRTRTQKANIKNSFKRR